MRAVTFHNVIAEPLDLFDRRLPRIHVNRFQRTIEYLGQRYRLISGAEALACLDAGDPAPDALTLTFDDGFAGVYEAAFPVLARLGVTASVFIHTEEGQPIPPAHLLHFELLELAFRVTTRPELELSELGLLPLHTPQDRLEAHRQVKQLLKRQPLGERRSRQHRILDQLGTEETQLQAELSARTRKLSAEQIRALLAHGWTIGGHTRSHPALRGLDTATLREEVAGNARDLEAAFGLRGVPFAYPYGGPEHFDSRAAAAVRDAGFCAAFTTIAGDNSSRTDRYRLHRFSDNALLSHHAAGAAPAAALPVRTAL